MKTFTDIEQSHKLLALGIPTESADGFYEAQDNPFTGEWEDILFVGTKWADERVVTPAWSLAALLELMPKSDNDVSIELYLCVNGQWAFECYSIRHKCIADDPLDAAVDMICWLKENKYI